MEHVIEFRDTDKAIDIDASRQVSSLARDAPDTTARDMLLRTLKSMKRRGAASKSTGVRKQRKRKRTDQSRGAKAPPASAQTRLRELVDMSMGILSGSFSEPPLTNPPIALRACDVSSEEGAELIHRSKKRKSKMVPVIPVSLHVSSVHVNGVPLRRPPSVEPVVRSLGELAQRFPHMQTEHKTPSVVETMDGKIVEVNRVPVEDERAVVGQRLIDHVAALPLPEFSHECARGLTRSQVVDMLRERRAVLPLLTASFESLLLAEAGEFPVDTDGRYITRVFPACMKGAECIASRIPCLELEESKPVPLVLTSLMYPAEYEHFIKTGVPPSERRCCILCYRAALQSLVLALRPNNQKLDVRRDFVAQVLCSRIIVGLYDI